MPRIQVQFISSISHFLSLEPWSEWSKSSSTLRAKTGFSKFEIEELERLCHSELFELREHQYQKKRKRKVELGEQGVETNPISPINMLLATFFFLWSYPKAAYNQLASDFHSSPSKMRNIVTQTLQILDEKLKPLREWPSNYKNRIAAGEFKDTIGVVDAFPIVIKNRPKTDTLRRKFWYYRERRWAWKVQTFVGLHNKLLDITDPYPYGANADQTIYRSSIVCLKLDENNRAVDLREKETEESEENESEENESEENDGKEKRSGRRKTQKRLRKGAGDKGYRGLPYLYLPIPKPKEGKMKRRDKKYNRDLSSIRSIVENVHKRLEDFDIIGTEYRGNKKYDKKERQFLSMVVRVIASLVNFKLDRAPLRKSRKH
jgi:hypothetical protein